MTIKEITALRRAGKLEEALQAAKAEFSININPFTVGALFWCLNDLYKTQDTSEALKTIQQMKTLFEKYCPNDEFMQKAVTTSVRVSSPNFKEMQDALGHAKAGDDSFVHYHKMYSLYKEGKLETELYQDFGWLIYYTLKDSQFTDVFQRKIMLHTYLQLPLPKPSLLHSLILDMAIKLKESAPKQFYISKFTDLWGLSNLTEDDWKQYISDRGHNVPSRVEKLIGKYVEDVKITGHAVSEELGTILDKAIEKFPNNQNLPYYKAKVLISEGRKEEALDYYKQLLLRFPSKQYLWVYATDLVDDSDTKIGLLSRALTTGVDEEFLGSARLQMAIHLIRKGEVANAGYELKKYRDTYQGMGWQLKDKYWDIFNQIASVDPVENNSDLYRSYIKYADDFLYSHMPKQLAVKVAEKQVEDRNKPGRKFTVWILRTEYATLHLKKPAKYGLNRKAKNGSVYSVRVHDGKVVWITPTNRIPITNWLREISGVIQIRTDRNGKPYAILNNTYIGETLLKGIEEGTRVSIISIKQDNNRWRALSLRPIS